MQKLRRKKYIKLQLKKQRKKLVQKDKKLYKKEKRTQPLLLKMLKKKQKK